MMEQSRKDGNRVKVEVFSALRMVARTKRQNDADYFDRLGESELEKNRRF